MSKPIASNKKAYHEYEVLETFECGIELKGSEVKSLRAGKVVLEDGFARVEKAGVTLYNTHITPYTEASYLNVEPSRPRRLLLHKDQINKLSGKVRQKGCTLVPTKVYFNLRGFAKVEIALCKGKKLYDRRESIKRRELDVGLRRVVKARQR